MTNRNFYRTVIILEVLSEEPVGNASMSTIAHNVSEGDWSGFYRTNIQDKELNGKETATSLINQGSDPEFFMLDEDGNDLNEE